MIILTVIDGLNQMALLKIYDTKEADFYYMTITE
jgi:hypothetical protein